MKVWIKNKLQYLLAINLVRVQVSLEITLLKILIKKKKDNLYFVKAEKNEEDEIVFDSIKRFKGLEREIVILFDLEDALENPEEMYIGLSRPKLILDIIGTEKNIEILNKISEDG